MAAGVTMLSVDTLLPWIETGGASTNLSSSSDEDISNQLTAESTLPKLFSMASMASFISKPISTIRRTSFAYRTSMDSLPPFFEAWDCLISDPPEGLSKLPKLLFLLEMRDGAERVCTVWVLLRGVVAAAAVVVVVAVTAVGTLHESLTSDVNDTLLGTGMSPKASLTILPGVATAEFLLPLFLFFNLLAPWMTTDDDDDDDAVELLVDNSFKKLLASTCFGDGGGSYVFD
jgi:hypothetical protein